MLAAPHLRKLSLHGSSDLISMPPIALEELSLKKILMTDVGAKALKPSIIRLEALRTLHLRDVFHPMLDSDPFVCPNLNCLSIEY